MGKGTSKSKRKLKEDRFVIEEYSQPKKKKSNSTAKKNIKNKKNNKTHNKPNNKKFIFVEAILIFIIITSIVFSVYLYNEVSLSKKNYKRLVKEDEKLISEIASKTKEDEELQEQITYYSNLDDNINAIKTEYFSKIKELEDKIISGESDKKIAYITFDDGPYYNTYNVLNILDQYNVKATFFTISLNGEYCYDNSSEYCLGLYKEYVKRGHTIANHTYTHGIFRGLYSSTDAFMDAIVRQEERIKEQTGGYVTNITRFPGGSATAKGLKYPIIEKLRERGYGWVDWTANDGDGGSLKSTEQAWSNFVSTINSDIEVILFHDYSWVTTSILPDVIEYLQNNGYEIYPLFYESNMINK